MKIGFTREILIPCFDLYPEFLKNNMLRNCTYGSSCNSTRLLDANKTVSSEQEEAVELINKGIIKINKTNFPIFDV